MDRCAIKAEKKRDQDQIGKQFCPESNHISSRCGCSCSCIGGGFICNRSTLMCRKIAHSSTFKRRLKLITAVNLDDKLFNYHNNHNVPHIYILDASRIIVSIRRVSKYSTLYSSPDAAA